MRRFWRSIRDAWRGSVKAENAPPAAPPVLSTGAFPPAPPMGSYIGFSFSSASGQCVHLNGRPTPHWPTADMPLADTCSSDERCFYDLTLQDRRWVEHCPTSSKGLSKKWSIDLCSAMAWEGMSSLQMSLVPTGETEIEVLPPAVPSHEDCYVELPLHEALCPLHSGYEEGGEKGGDCVYISLVTAQTGGAYITTTLHLQVAVLDASSGETCYVFVEVALGETAAPEMSCETAVRMHCPVMNQSEVQRERGERWTLSMFEIKLEDVASAVSCRDTCDSVRHCGHKTYEYNLLKISLTPTLDDASDVPLCNPVIRMGSVAVFCARWPAVRAVLQDSIAAEPQWQRKVTVAGLQVRDGVECVDGR